MYEFPAKQEIWYEIVLLEKLRLKERQDVLLAVLENIELNNIMGVCEGERLTAKEIAKLIQGSIEGGICRM